MRKILFLWITCEVLFLSCASKPLFKGHADLCGLVIDENNAPVKDFIVYCKAADMKTWGTKPLITPVITNESGLFVFYGLSSGDYILSGEKTGYLRITSTSYSFNDRTRIICLQTKSFKASVLNVGEMLRLGQKEEAIAILRGICCEHDSLEEIFLKDYTEKLEEGGE